MNELIFIIHAFFIMLCSLGSLHMGKEMLIGLISLLAILSNLFVTKQIMLFGLSATPTDALTVGLALTLNLLQEYYGKKSAKQAIAISFALSLIYTILSQFHLAYLPSMYDTTHLQAAMLFGFMPRIMGASLTTYFLVQRFDSYLYEELKQRLGNRYLVGRAMCSAVISQFLDTVLFSFLGLYGTVNSLFPIIAISFCIKLLVITGATPFIWFSKKIFRVKHHETISI